MDGQRQTRRSPVRSCDHHPAGGEPSPDASPPRLAPAPPRRPVQAQRRSRPEAPAELSDRWAAVLGIGWPLAIVASMVLEPTPADPDAPGPVLAELASLGLLFALVGTAIAAGVRHGAAGGRRRDRPARRGLGDRLPGLQATAIRLWWFAELAS